MSDPFPVFYVLPPAPDKIEWTSVRPVPEWFQQKLIAEAIMRKLVDRGDVELMTRTITPEIASLILD